MTAALWPSRDAIFVVAEPIIMLFESFRGRAYLCSAAKPTIGYGSTRYANGVKVTLADKQCSEAEARVLLRYSMGRVLADLQKPGLVTRSPTAKQSAALLSLAYNCGVGLHDGIKGDVADSTLLALFNSGEIPAAADQFLLWNKARVGGAMRSIPGLTNRRQAERLLFLAPA
jgi:lysozyme